jgi:hypothetical protein
MVKPGVWGGGGGRERAEWCVGCKSSNDNISREQSKAKHTGRLSGTDRHAQRRVVC